MKNLFAKFLSLSLKMKIITVAVPSVLVIGAVATPIIINANKEPIEAPIDVAEATVEPTIESTEEPTTAPVIEKTEDETVIEPEVVEPEVEETVVEEPTEVVETEVEEVTEEFVADDAGETYNFEGDNKMEAYEATVPDNYELSYIVNGIDIRSGDNDGDGVNDNHGNTWYEGQVFTASNGVKVRIADGFDVNALVPHWDAIFVDGTENAEPGSPYMIAINEYLGTADKSAISPNGLPQVNTPSSKQTTFNKDDASFQAYKASFDPLWQTQNTGSPGGFSMLQAFDNNHDGVADGVGLLDGLGSLGYMWQMNYDASNGYWKLEIYSNYTALIWDSIHNSIRMITPDGDAVYKEIYNQCYYDNPTFPEYDMWVTIGNTQVLASINDGLYFLIK